MNKIKEFVRNNKIIITSFTIVIILAFVAIVVVLFNKSERKNEEKNSDTIYETNEIETTTVNLSSKETTEKTTLDEITTDETTKEETTIEETTTEEPITEPIVPIDYQYIIKINRIANCITVYGKDENGNYNVPIKAFTVSCGKNIDDTPVGQFSSQEWYKWGMMFDGSYAQYAYRIVDSILFHSVPYYTISNGELDWDEYNKLGTSASHGCVRMTVADAKWLVENCPYGTQVIIYDDIDNPGPLGKPDTIKIPVDSPYRGWDPTDPNPNNPWNNFSVSMTFPSSKKISLIEGDSIEKLRSHFSAKDTCGNTITDKIVFLGQLDLNKAGTYNNVIVSVTDAIGRNVEVEVTVIVKAKEVPTTTTTKAETTTEAETTEPETTTELETTVEEEINE